MKKILRLVKSSFIGFFHLNYYQSVCLQVHQVGNLLSSNSSSLLCVIFLYVSLSSLFYSQGTINLRGSMKELLLEQQLGTLNRFRSGTLRRCHHRMTDRQIGDMKRKKEKIEKGKRYLILILIRV